MTLLAWCFALLAAVLGLRLAFHARQLSALHAWLRRPELARMPRGRGVWENVLAELHRYLKRRESEHEALGGTLARLRAAARALPDGVVILDPEAHIEWVNPTAARHFGIDPSRDAGQPVANLVRHPQFVAYLNGGDYREALVLRASHAGATLSLRLVEFGEDRRLLISRDVTAEERLEAMRRDFIANVSHELKTPVTVLAGFVETLSDETLALAPAERRRFLGMMADQASRMQRLVEDLLTLSSLESSAPPPNEPIALAPLLEQLVEEARALSGGHHRIETSIEASARLMGSAGEIRSAFANLISNAVRYTPAGGSVQVRWNLAHGQGIFSVQDSGIGIEARHLPRLTERFYRIDSGRSRASGGTGLGLAIVKHVLTRHQAVLEVASQPGRGSTFSAVFPAARVLPPDEDRQAA